NGAGLDPVVGVGNIAEGKALDVYRDPAGLSQRDDIVKIGCCASKGDEQVTVVAQKAPADRGSSAAGTDDRDAASSTCRAQCELHRRGHTNEVQHSFSAATLG